MRTYFTDMKIEKRPFIITSEGPSLSNYKTGAFELRIFNQIIESKCHEIMNHNEDFWLCKWH